MSDIQNIVDLLISKNIQVEKGLSALEINLIEKKFNFVFPPDLKELLEIILPVDKDFANWRKAIQDDAFIQDRFLHIEDGFVFDALNNNFWKENWGIKSENEENIRAVIRNELMKVPKMIPIYSHRYIPSEPFKSGNPIFSIYQTDIIIYGKNLKDYFFREFDNNKNEILLNEVKLIPFWSDLL